MQSVASGQAGNRVAVVIGGGFAGMMAAMSLIRAGVTTHLLEQASTLGGLPAWLGFMFPTSACLLCRSGSDHGYGCPRPTIGPEFLEMAGHPLLKVHLGAELVGIEGEFPRFLVRLRHQPAASTVPQAVRCGTQLTETAPPMHDSLQAMPGHATVGESEIGANLVIVATGGHLFDPRKTAEFGYGRFPGVLTGMDVERMLSRNGPTEGKILAPDGSTPKRVAWLQCVGSRDEDHDYCSSFCCMYATKQAILAKQENPDIDCTIFVMDNRMYAKQFASSFEKAKEEYGIRYQYCRISSLKQRAPTGNLYFRYVNNDGRLVAENYDLVVLSTGVQPETSFFSRMGIATTSRGFPQRQSHMLPGRTNREGIFVCGNAAGPKDIADTAQEAAAAAAAAISLLKTYSELNAGTALGTEENEGNKGEGSGTAVIIASYPGMDPLKPEALAEQVIKWPNVTGARVMALPNSLADASAVSRWLADGRVASVVAAAGSARQHRRFFERIAGQAGIPLEAVEYVPLASAVASVHRSDGAAAHAKARALLRAAVARAEVCPVRRSVSSERKNQTTLVVGGGAAGLSAALHLAEAGMSVVLVERSQQLGGHLLSVPQALDGENLADSLRSLLGRVSQHPNISVRLGSTVLRTTGTLGNFLSRVSDGKQVDSIEHGALIAATGASEYHGNAYHLNDSPRVITLLELERELQREPRMSGDLREVVFISCVGPWDESARTHWRCSRLCCQGMIRNAIRFKRANPDAKINVLVRETMTTGESEAYYTKAREIGVLFTRVSPESRPQVTLEGEQLRAIWRDPALREDISVTPDLIVLAAATMPQEDTFQTMQSLGLPGLDDEGFFAEREAKVAPFATSKKGMYVIGLAQAPKPLEMNVAQGLAAAQDVLNLFGQQQSMPERRTAVVAQEKCVACLTCVRICPYQAPRIDHGVPGVGGIMGAAFINPLACEGCGACVAECPQDAISLAGYDSATIAHSEMAYFQEIEEMSQ